MSWHSSCYRQTRALFLSRTSRHPPAISHQPPRHSLALGFPHRSAGCSCRDHFRRGYYATVIRRDDDSHHLHSQAPSTSHSTSNIDLHPTPIDETLFEDEAPDVYQIHLAQPAAQQAASYQAPSPAALLHKLLAGEGTGRDHFLSDRDLSEAYTVLRQLKDLDSELGPPHPYFVTAAVAAFPLRKHREALEWLEMIPSWWDVTTEADDIAFKLTRLLNYFCARTLIKPQTFQRVLEILFEKQWHSHRSLGEPFVKAAFHVYNLTPERFGISELWSRLAAAMNAPGKGDSQRRAIMSRYYHIALRLLALNGRFNEASRMVLLSDPFHPTWCPPIAGFTWKLLFEELSRNPSDENMLIMHALQAHVQSISHRLLKSPHLTRDKKVQKVARTAYNLGPAAWSIPHATYLLKRSEEFLTNFAGKDKACSREEIPYAANVHLKAQRQAREIEAARRRASHLAEQAKAEQRPKSYYSLEGLVKRLSQQDEIGDTLVSSVASHQLRLLRSSNDHDEGAPLPSEAAPLDRDSQTIIYNSRGGRGLWEMSYLWLLVMRGQHRDALYYFRRTWHTTMDVSADLLDVVSSGDETLSSISNQLGVGSQDFLLFPSTYVLNLINVSIVQTALEGVTHYTEARRQRAEILLSAVSRLERGYRIWVAALLHMQTTDCLERRRLDSRAFDPWINGLLSQYTKLIGLGIQNDDETDPAALIAELSVFQGLNEDASPMNLSVASLRSLRFMRDMQTLNIEPTLVTYTIILDTLARDAPRSWPLIERICFKWGLMPSPRNSSSNANKSSDLTRSGEGKRSLLVTFTALLRGLHAVPNKLGGEFSALAQSRQVREWLRDLTYVDGVEQSADTAFEKFFTEDDIKSDVRLMDMLAYAKRVEREAKDSQNDIKCSVGQMEEQ